MSFTRFYDDPARIQKRLDLSTFEGRYQLNRPGPGTNMPFMEDPNLRLQSWGANLQTNTVNLESYLRNMTRKLNRDFVDVNEYKQHAAHSNPIRQYESQDPFVEESRASHPAWAYRVCSIDRFEQPIIVPQQNLERPFLNNVQTRILRRNGSF